MGNRLTPEAIILLKELQGRPEWAEILTKINEVKIPAYKQIKAKDSSVLSSEIQERSWIFASGRQKEREVIVKLLTIGETE